MKKSNYNFLFPGEEGTTILYNSRTGAMAELDKEHTVQLKNLSEQELEEQNPAFANALLANGFAVDINVSELDMICYDMLRTRFGNRSLGVTITVTKDCNFGCKYCYEKDILKKGYMDKETQDAIIKYIETNLVKGGSLNICWYGGEPLLDIETIKSMSQRLITMCAENDVEYEADIVTNGYLLTDDIAKLLIENKVTQIQITLDGDEDTHNQRRPLKDGTNTYQRIWNNLMSLRQFSKDITIALRVNIDKNNEGALDEIRRKIQEQKLDDFIFVYPGKVISVESCHNREECHSNREFAILKQKYLCDNKKMLLAMFPKPHKICCSADNERSVIFDSEGNMYKCFMDIGNSEMCIGNVKKDELYHENILHQYLLYDVTKDNICMSCHLLPICLGGCPSERLQGKKECIDLKYTLTEYMNHLPEAIKSRGKV